MGFLGKGRKAKARNHRTTIVAEGTRICGELNVSANLHVDGLVEGSIVCEHGVSVGRTGQVDHPRSCPHDALVLIVQSHTSNAAYLPQVESQARGAPTRRAISTRFATNCVAATKTAITSRQAQASCERAGRAAAGARVFDADDAVLVRDRTHRQGILPLVEALELFHADAAD